MLHHPLSQVTIIPLLLTKLFGVHIFQLLLLVNDHANHIVLLIGHLL